MDMWLLIKRCENADYKIFHFLLMELKIHICTLDTVRSNGYNVCNTDNHLGGLKCLII